MLILTLCFCNVELITLYGFSVNYILHFHLSKAFWSFIDIFIKIAVIIFADSNLKVTRYF